MREIKFRAWIEREINYKYNNANKLSLDKYGDHFDEYKGNDFNNFDEWYDAKMDYRRELLDSFKGKEKDFVNEMNFDAFSINANGSITSRVNYKVLDIMQYTGLKDKNGKEIYEGDIVKGSWGFIGVVEYDENYLQYRFKNDREIDYYGLNKIQIIGNIYENPELLNDK